MHPHPEAAEQLLSSQHAGAENGITHLQCTEGVHAFHSPSATVHSAPTPLPHLRCTCPPPCSNPQPLGASRWCPAQGSWVGVALRATATGLEEVAVASESGAGEWTRVSLQAAAVAVAKGWTHSLCDS
jgi:hypothetical protein